MKILLDTNIFTRIVEPGHPMHQPAEDAVAVLRSASNDLYHLPQNLYEFWPVCTRPVSANGLGKSANEAAVELAKIKSGFKLLPDAPDILPTWEHLIVTYSVIGKTAHDARLVAAMLVHGVTQILTFNEQDFVRFPMITVLTPAAVLATTPRAIP